MSSIELLLFFNAVIIVGIAAIYATVRENRRRIQNIESGLSNVFDRGGPFSVPIDETPFRQLISDKHDHRAAILYRARHGTSLREAELAIARIKKDMAAGCPPSVPS